MAIPKVLPQDWQVLQVVQRIGAIPQHKLADRTARRRSTVNGAAQRLLASGWLERVGQEAGGRGRPAILLAVDRTIGCFCGVDITADALHAAVVGADGALLDQATTRLGEDRTFAIVLDQIDLVLRGLLSRVDTGPEKLLGLWAGVSGVVDEHGIVVSCASLHWHNEPLKNALAKQYACDPLVQGGASIMNAAAESLMGAGREADSLVHYHAGRGISARFVRHGQPLTGATQRAGEFGHVVVNPGGPRCACGNTGCLEAVASGPAIVAAVKRLGRDVPDSLRKLAEPGSDEEARSVVKAIFDFAQRDEDGALSGLMRQVTNHLAMGAAMAIAAYDPEVLVLGGYLFEDAPSLFDDVRNSLRSMVLDGDQRDCRVVRAEVISRDRAVGGAAEVCQRFWANPRGVLASG